MIRITLQYFDGCPHSEATGRTLAALLAEGSDAAMEEEVIASYAEAVERGFRGSPTVLVDGVDPFADRDAPPALACRIYQTESGPAGSPSIAQLRQVIAQAGKGDSHDPQR